MECDPDFVDAYSNLGAVLRRMGDLDGAIHQYEEAIRRQPNFAAAHYNLGNAYNLRDEKTLAAEAYRRAIAHQPDYSEAWNNLARLLNDTGHHEEALEACLEGLAHAPDNPHLQNNAGNAYQALGRASDAIRSYQQVIEAAPQMNTAYSNLGIALKDIGELEAALAIHRRAVQLAPEDTGTLNNYGSSLQSADHLDDAVAAFRRALEIAPEDIVTQINLGTALVEQNDMDGAIALFEQVVDSASFGDEKLEHAMAHKNLGLALMGKGDFTNGIRHYAWRWETPEFTPMELDSPVWVGEELNGESVLITAEQGFGDAIQFARFAQHIAARGGRPVWQAPPPLAPLIKTANGMTDVVLPDDDLAEFDYHIPMFDLLGALNIGPADLPGPNPYIEVDPKRMQTWEDRIPATGRLRVGLVWAGRPTHANDRKRSITLETLLPLLRLTNVDFYALQVGERSDDIRSSGLENDLIDLSPHLGDFADTAAALSQLDLLISVDTSVAHVAGAINRPAWILIPFAPDWRWGREGQETVWYPSLTLWRQESAGAWPPVIEAMASALTKLASEPQA